MQTGVAKGRSLNGAEVISVPYLRVANVQDGYLDLTEIKNIEIRRSELPRFSLRVGDVVLTEGGDFDKLGRGFIWNGEIAGCVHQNHIFAARANRSMILPEFLAYLTQSPYGKAYFLSVAHKTTNLACINTTKLKAFPALVPPLQDQQQIVHALTAVDRKIAVEGQRRTAPRFALQGTPPSPHDRWATRESSLTARSGLMTSTFGERTYVGAWSLVAICSGS